MTEALTWMAGNPGKAAATIMIVLVVLLAGALFQNTIDKRRK